MIHGFMIQMLQVDEMETMATAEHFMATDVDWDPTGRYVATVVSHAQQMENGAKFWTFAGKELYRCEEEGGEEGRDVFAAAAGKERRVCGKPERGRREGIGREQEARGGGGRGARRPWRPPLARLGCVALGDRRRRCNAPYPTLRRRAACCPYVNPHCPRCVLPLAPSPRSVQRDKLFQFSWRPRPPSLLPAEKEAEIVKNLKAYAKRYDEEDEALIMQVRS
jgi:hypothetical protein